MHKIVCVVIACLLILQSGCGIFLAKDGSNRVSRVLQQTLLDAKAISIEVSYLEGSEPDQDALEHLRDNLVYYTDADDADVSIRINPAITGSFGGEDWDWARLMNGLHSEPAPGLRILKVLYVDRMNHSATYGFYTDWRGVPSITVFKNAVRDAAILMISVSEVEKTILAHEVAHGYGVPEKNDHNDGTNHCTRPDCCLYKPVDWRAIVTNWWRVLFFWELPNDLCSRCQEEISYYQRDG